MAPSYRELPPPPGLEAHVACLWTSHDRATRVLPDACADIVFVAGRVIVAGPATEAISATPTPGQGRCGVRFRVGSAGAVLGLPVIELLDLAVPVAELWGAAGRRLEDRVAAAPTIEAALAALTRGVAERVPRPAAATRSSAAPRSPWCATARRCPRPAARVGLGERQLRRRFERAVGYGPATLVRDPALPALPRARRATARRGAEPPRGRGRLRRPGAPDARMPPPLRPRAGRAAGGRSGAGGREVRPAHTARRRGRGARGLKSVSFKPRGAACGTLVA